MLHEAENTNDSNFNGGLANASSSLINQDEDSTITPLEENSTINPLDEVVSIMPSLEENSTVTPLAEEENSTTPEYSQIFI
jgi:hypothetical protein